jgi:hypothetical protein
MTLSTLPPFLIVLAVMAIAAFILIPSNYAIQWFGRNLRRAGVAYSFLVAVTATLLLLLIPLGAVPSVLLIPVAVLGVAGAGYGWIRYHRSPYLRRWEATHEQFAKMFKSNPGAAERFLLQALVEEDRHRERLRALAPHDRSAALEFRALTQEALKSPMPSQRLAARVEPDVPPGQRGLPLIAATRRERLEADLEWIRTILASVHGAA